MFKLNFKEALTEVAKDVAKDAAHDLVQGTVDEIVIDDSVEDGSLPPSIIHDPNLSYERPSESLIEAKANAQVLLEKVEPKNLFTLPSILTVLFFMFSTVYIDLDQALEDNKISTREFFKLFYLAFGGLVTLVARYNDPKTDVYTPHNVLGKDREYFVDLNKDGIDDRDQDAA